MTQRRTVRPHGASRYRHGPDENGAPGKGCRCLSCRRARKAEDVRRERLIASGQWEGYADATGTRRRLQALVRCGWPLARLSVRLGASRELEAIVRPGGPVLVRPFTARAVAALYDELWDQAPPRQRRYDRAGSARAVSRAVAEGWPAPQAWDDDPGPHCIDDPAAVPAPGWERQDRREWGSLTEEAAELAAIGEHVEMIAARLGASVATVTRTLERVASVRATGGRRVSVKDAATKEAA